MAPTMIRGLPHFREVSSFPGPWLRRVLADPIGHFTASLRSKRFRLVSEQKRTEEGDFRFWPREKWNERQKMKEGRGVSSPPPPSLRASSPIWVSEASLARTRERRAWLVSLSQIGELARRLTPSLLFYLRHFFARSLTYSCSSFFAPKPHRNACYAGSFYGQCKIVCFVLRRGFSQKIWYFA